jgi:hypothetical protein
MSRFLSHSSRRIFAVVALATATAVPSVVMATQSGTGAATALGTMTTYAVKWH